MLNLNKIKKLRQETGISIALCKKAIEQSRGNLEKARKLLNQWGIEKVKDKANRSTAQGAIFAYVHHNKKIASLIEILCETDFVARNNKFQNLGQELAMQIASSDAKSSDDLLNQEYIRDPNIKISDLIKDAILKFGENIKIGKFTRFEI